jgi:levanase
MQHSVRAVRPRARRRAALVALIASTATLAAGGTASADPPSAPSAAPTTSYQELYRPQFHFTPAQNWMNDPNGLVYYRGEYHLFFQHNPFGNQWGNMSWGHAVSRDLVHWKQLPVAIPAEGDELIFSGSAVVDYQNTSGFGTRHNPPMVAIYTSARPNSQAQSLAYSTDSGRTWTKYSGNPVLDIGSNAFRDPKVFWYASQHKWVMAVSKADQHQISLYSSSNLKQWTHMSDFGPANATGGAWECPDLFPLAVDGNPRHTKWVMIVNVNPGGIAGGSGAQYFVGDFDGTTFTADNQLGAYTPPAGDVYQDFEAADYGAWTTIGTAFGSAPAHGTLPGQQAVSGFQGNGLVNSFRDFDNSQGTLTSPPFTITRRYLNFLVGGGDHPYVPGGSDAPPPGTVFADFEGDTYGPGWTATGDFANAGPVAESLPGQQGAKALDTCVGPCDPATGTIRSPDFRISSRYIDFLIAGGHHPMSGPGPTAVNLVVDGQVVATATGPNSGNLDWVAWDVGALQGKTAHIEVVDQHAGTDWGHIMVDQIVFSDRAAAPWNAETGVNLLVDGQVVRTATGANSETLDWTHWDLSDLIGKTAQIQIIDRNTGGWGHILADQFMFADQPAESVVRRSSWLDYGKDFYAAVTYNDVPDGRRIAIGWMNNWNYAGDIPTSPWRSAMSVPRELGLRHVDGQLRVVQQPVRDLRSLRTRPSYVQPFARRIPAGTTTLPARGKALEIYATLRVGAAQQAGLNVRTAAGEHTAVGYDATTGEVYVDRTQSGQTAFNADFPGVQRAPLTAHYGKVRLHILVDWSSVEVFADHGQRVITDQIFPSPASDGLQLFATGGRATIDSLAVIPLRSSWTGARS